MGKKKYLVYRVEYKDNTTKEWSLYGHADSSEKLNDIIQLLDDQERRRKKYDFEYRIEEERDKGVLRKLKERKTKRKSGFL